MRYFTRDLRKYILLGTPIFVIAILLCLFNIQLDSDSLRFFKAYNSEYTHSIDYWFKIYTSTINFGQYRPSSFFSQYYLFELLRLNSAYFYVLLNFCFFIFGINFLFKNKKNLDIFQIGILLTYVLFNSSAPSLLVSSFTFKYHLLFLYVCYLCNLIDRKVNFDRFLLIKLFIFQIIAITCHEAAITFPFLLIFHFLKKDIKRVVELLIISIPSLVYVFVRVFIWKLADAGFLKIDFANVHKVFSYYLSTGLNSFDSKASLLLSYNHSFYFIAPVLFILALFYVSLKKKKEIRLFLSYFLALSAIALPFCLISNHTAISRSVWLVPIILSMMHILFKNNKSKWFSVIVFFVIAPGIYRTTINYKIYYKSINEGFKLKNEIFKTIYSFEHKNINIVNSISDDQRLQLLTSVSTFLKEGESMVIRINELEKIVFIDNSYFSIDHQFMTDPFGQRHKLSRDIINVSNFTYVDLDLSDLMN